MTEFEKQALVLLKEIKDTLFMIEINTASMESLEQQRQREAKTRQR